MVTKAGLGQGCLGVEGTGMAGSTGWLSGPGGQGLPHPSPWPPSPGSPLPKAMEPLLTAGLPPAASQLRPKATPSPAPRPPMFFNWLFLLAWGVLLAGWGCLCCPRSSCRSNGQTRPWPAGLPFQEHVPDPVLWGRPPESPWACAHVSRPGPPTSSPLSTTSRLLLRACHFPLAPAAPVGPDPLPAP